MLKELFENNKNIIINTDIDGILSGALLVKYLGCQIVGFTNSKDRVWLDKNQDDLYRHIYVDMFVTDDRAICIDQHIVAINDEHQEKIKAAGTKHSPQIEGNRIFTDRGFKYKYPFGTTQYILAQLIAEGFDVSLPDLDTPVPDSGIRMGDLIHRADDAMNSTLCSYVANARNWWNWLAEKSGNSPVIGELIEYLEDMRRAAEATGDCENRLKKEVDTIKKNTKQYFNEKFACRTGDGGFKEILGQDNHLLPNIIDYITTVFSLMDCEDVNLPTVYATHKGIYCRTRWLPIFEKEFQKDYTICGHKVFSYAFIYGPGNDSMTNFSFTIDME